MALANFEQLCKGYCELAGLAAPAVAPDESGTAAFTVCVRGVDVTVMEMPELLPDTALLIAEFGKLPADKAHAGWRVLMESNLHMIGPQRALFSREPDTGNVLLHRTLRLADATPTEVFQQVEWLADMALDWRDGYFLNAPVAHAQMAMAGAVQSVGPAAFA